MVGYGFWSSRCQGARRFRWEGPYAAAMILYLAADLMWASKIKGHADALGLACRPVRSVEMLEARLADCEVVALVVDLDKPEESMAMIGRVRQEQKPIRVLAFGPHVERGLLQAARDAGADGVMTRGMFDRDMPEILMKLSTGARV